MTNQSLGSPDGSEPSAAVRAEATPEQVLATPMGTNDAGATTVRGYLIQLLAEVWRKTDDFSGKRPFGNSGWDWDLMIPLMKAGYITGTLDEDGYIEDCDERTGRRLIAVAIGHLGASPSAASTKESP